MGEEDKSILGLDRDDIKTLMSQCYLSTKVLAKVLFPDRFCLPFSALHDKIFEILDNDSIQQALIVAPRGFGKTSCVNLAYPAKKILFEEKKFIVPISCTASQAVMQGENLKRELMTNRMIKGLFGSLKSDTFSKEMWVTANGVAVLPRGSGQQVRGILHGDSRPDLIIVDDLEDKEGVNSEEQRAKLKEWFFEDVMNSINRASKDWKIIVIGSLLHEDSLLANLLLDPDWYHAHLSICDPETFKSNWPDFMNDEAITKLINSYRRVGLLNSFYREYMGVPIAKESAQFRQEMFKMYRETDDDFVKNQRKKLENIVIFDPAKTVKSTSDRTAVVGLGVDAEKPAIYVRDVIVDRLHPDEQYRAAFDMADRLKAKVIGVEVTSLNEFITYPLKTMMMQERRYYDLVELKARASKIERIAALVPFYRLGFVYHNEGCCNVLESQLLSYPKSKEDDVMDAVAYVVEMLELGERYFIPANEVDKDGKPKDIEDEFKDLMGDDDFEQLQPLSDWRTA